MVTFFKDKFTGDGFNEINSKNLDIYLQKESSHMSYPSLWGAAEYFDIVLRSIGNTGSLSDAQKNALRLFECYLKGIFIRVLELDTIDFSGKDSLFYETLLDLFPFNGLSCEDSRKNGDFVILKYGEDVVALESPYTLFFPSAYFSYWPYKPDSADSKGMESEIKMLKVIENLFNRLDDKEKDLYYNWIENIKGVLGERLPGVFSRILGGKGYNKRDDWRNDLFPSLNSICVSNGDVFLYNLKKDIKDKFEVELKFDSNSGNLSIAITESDKNPVSIPIMGVKGRDGNYYMFGEFIKTEKDFTIEVKSYGKLHQEKFQYHEGKLIVKFLSLELMEFDVCVLRDKSQIFANKILKVGDKLPENVLRKNFQFNGKSGIVLHYDEKKEEFYINVNGEKISKSYDKKEIVEMGVTDIRLKMWPEKPLKGWNYYFLYYQLTDGISLGMDNLQKNGSGVKKLTYDDIVKEKYLFDFYEGKEFLGSFSLGVDMDEEISFLPLSRGIKFGIDFGTSTTVVAYEDLNGGGSTPKVMEFDFNPLDILGDKYVLMNIFPESFSGVKEIESSLVRVKGKNIQNFENGFEEYYIPGGIGQLSAYLSGVENSLLSIQSNLKWSGNVVYIKSYMYLLLILSLWNYCVKNNNTLPSKIILNFSYPLAMASTMVDRFEDAVNKVISELKKLINNKNFEITANFIDESNVYSYVGKVDKKVLFIDMGGETVDMYYKDKDGKVAFVDSIKFGGNYYLKKLLDNNKTLIDLLAEVKRSKYDYVTGKDSKGDNCENFGLLLIKYVSLCLYGKNNKGVQSSEMSYDNILEKIGSLVDKVYLVGNGWRLFDIFGSQFNTKENFFSKRFGGSNTKVYYFDKSKLAEGLVEAVLQNKSGKGGKDSNQSSQSGGGVKTIVGLNGTLYKDQNQKYRDVEWYEDVPLTLFKNTQGILPLTFEISNFNDPVLKLFAGNNTNSSSFRGAIRSFFRGNMLNKGNFLINFDLTVSLLGLILNIIYKYL